MSNLGDLDRLVAQIKHEKGKLDIVFANAGVAKYAPFGEITEVLYDEIFDINDAGRSGQPCFMSKTGWQRDGWLHGLSARGRPQARRLRRPAARLRGLTSAAAERVASMPSTPHSVLYPGGRNAAPAWWIVFAACSGLGGRDKIEVCLIFVSQGWGSVYSKSRRTNHAAART